MICNKKWPFAWNNSSSTALSDHQRVRAHKPEAARDRVLHLRRQLLGDLALQSAQQKRPQHTVQPVNQLLVGALLALNHTADRIEPLFELALRRKDVRHQKVHQRPELHQVVLQRRAGQQQAVLRLEGQQRLPPLRLEVLDVMRLVEDQVVPRLAPKDDSVLAGRKESEARIKKANSESEGVLFQGILSVGV
jgi:hypothetical protein